MIKKILKFSLYVIFILALGFCIGMAIITSVNRHHKYHPNLKSGQVWVRNAEDPFKPKSDTIYILDVNGDYSKFKMNDSIDSDRNMWVVWNAKLLKDVK